MSDAQAKQVTEYALVELLPGGDRQGLFSDVSLALVQHVQAEHALAGKRNTVIVKRECSYPLDAKGNVIHAHSTVDESDLAAA